MAHTIKRIETERDLADAALNEAQQAIKDRLREKGLRKIPGVVTWSAVKGRSGWNNAAIREALENLGINLDEYKTEGEPTDRLVITVKTS
jgi:hypothetical protein